jgi:hypothetical protein
MVQSGSNVVIVNLNEFRAAIKASQVGMPLALPAALKTGGAPILAQLSTTVPTGTASWDHHPGLLRSSYGTSVRLTTASITSKAPYAGGAEWGTRGKWSGFGKYGGPPRFASKAVEDKAEEVAGIIYEELSRLTSILGWAH